MRRAILWLSALATALSLLSALAVAGSWLLHPAYRGHYGDSILFVAGYAALQAYLLHAFVRDTPAAPWAALARAVAGGVFVALFVSIGPLWMRVTPARYVYQLFDWGPEARIGLFALVFLGRGAFNSFAALELTRPWWWPLRDTRPLLGRLLTALAVALIVGFVWLFTQMVRLDAVTFSPDAYDVARLVLDDIDCETLRERGGQTTTDLRQRGDRKYYVTIRWRCTDVQVEVRDEAGKIGVARGPRLECCPDRGGLPS
jgi:hypothetical protein